MTLTGMTLALADKHEHKNDRINAWEGIMILTKESERSVLTTEDVLLTLCNSVTGVLSAATLSQVRFSGIVQRINKTCLKPDIGCFVLFDGGFSGLVVINFSARAAMELYERYMLNMGMAKDDLAHHYTADDVSNAMGELMNQIIGHFTMKVERELQTHITQNQPKMLTLSKQVTLSVDTHLDNPQSRRVTFYTAGNHLFYIELSMDKTEFIRLYQPSDGQEKTAEELVVKAVKSMCHEDRSISFDHDDLLDSLGL